MSAGAGYEGSTQKKGVMGASAARQSSMILSPAFSTADGSFSSPGKGSSPCPAPCWELRDRVSGPANTVSIRRRGSSPSQDAQSSETVTAVPVAWHGAGQGRVPLRERRRREKQTKETGAKEYTGVRQRSEVCKRVRPILAAKTRNKKKQQVHKTKLRGERHTRRRELTSLRLSRGRLLVLRAHASIVQRASGKLLEYAYRCGPSLFLAIFFSFIPSPLSHSFAYPS